MLWLLRSAIVILYPRTSLPGAVDCDLDGHLRKFRDESPFLIWLGTVTGALVFHLTPLFTVYLPLPAFLLPAKLADRHAEKITSTDVYLVRQAVFLVKLCAGLVWGADPEVRKRFAMPPLEKDPGTWRTS
ncbi:MAG: hypothetical protein ACOZQL_13470 [Myxococcota bacterium]